MSQAPKDFPNPRSNVIALVGDTHANTGWTINVIQSLAAEGVDMIVQLGDFGWWPTPEPKFARKVARTAAQEDARVCFIDGNHEHHHHLRTHAKSVSPNSSPTDPVEMYERLWYLPRGCAWEWHGVRFRALGGAFSIDSRQGLVP